MKIHRKYISRCIEIAQNGLGTTAPNPMVGAVIVYNEKIIGEGYTSAYGGSHAEVNAINSVIDKSLLLHATLYVTLEPCSHFGKTPPCADLIIKHKIPKIVIGLTDPHEKVAGAGIRKLEAAGCEVITRVLEKECRTHHKRFLTFHEKKRPYIILKWAETSDGFIAPIKEKRNLKKEPYWISNPYSRQMTHQWRAEEQAILVGTTTVLDDNPKLNLRHFKGNIPLRVIIDKELKINKSHNVLDGSQDTLIITEQKDSSHYIKDVHYECIDFKTNVTQNICDILYRKSITSLIIEGGAKTLQSFIDAKLWDEARIFTSSISFHKGIHAPKLSEELMNSIKVDTDVLNIYTND